MAIKTEQISEYIVKPVLKILGLSGHNIMLGIGAQESNMGTYIEQIGKGIHGRGWLQVEAATHDDVWRYLLRNYDPNHTKFMRDNWIQYLNPRVLTTVAPNTPCIEGAAKAFCTHTLGIKHDRLIYDLRYCCAIARLKLYMIPAPLPAENDIEGMADYWKKYYNSSKGKGSVKDFIANYDEYVRPYV